MRAHITRAKVVHRTLMGQCGKTSIPATAKQLFYACLTADATLLTSIQIRGTMERRHSTCCVHEGIEAVNPGIIRYDGMYFAAAGPVNESITRS